ncbi:Na+/H+ antiporter subunit E [Mycolicibacterium pulveris]|uniref:Na+/H+ antiporter subunit E n=1 Tax=Mycolicibacterium pulveris TaxID=36813 RepID=UPI003CF24B22
MRAALLRVSVLGGLILVWMLLWGSISAANFLGGLVVALVITLLLPLPVVPVEGKLHPLSLLRLVIQMVYWLVRSSIQVAWLAVRPGPPPISAVLRAQFALKSDLVLAMAVNLINLTPGTIALEVDQARRVVYVHVLNAHTERSVREFHDQMAALERLLKAALERDEDWRPAADKESA